MGIPEGIKAPALGKPVIRLVRNNKYREAAMPHGRRSLIQNGPDPIDVAVGWNIRRLRMTYGLSLQRFARSLDLSFQQVQKYETGTNRVAASTLVRIAEVLGVPVAALFEGVDAGGQIG